MAASMVKHFLTTVSRLRLKVCMRSVARQYSAETTAENVAKTVENVPKKPLRERIGLYFKKIFDDYVWAVKETGVYMKEKPIKSVVFITVTSSGMYLYKKNPTMSQYEAHLSAITCDLAEVGTALRNEEKSNKLQELIAYQSAGRLRRFTLGICSFIWVSEYPIYVDLYETQCKEVKLGWKEWTNYIVDVGVLGRWLWSQEYLKDFDINPEEWKHIEVKKQ